ncbi:hypothetical protein TBR22_A06570 [Luteitalea sp. TBR-22]|uniref:hypothetical protein n=1 Tax=Luteitalea sp. TBR-22 TaxID=2802971 RepID=UPI001AFC0645|nr:hypothetical protein [Luteitalea sp. TBR-22]BCS31456.1 hypothetical protein TBR22_A06570 [Luteitalea sp. TBR-22]
MIITDRLVYVHEPKTGGTFVTSALMRVHGVAWTPWFRVMTTLRAENVRTGPLGRFVYNNHKHGTCNDTPIRYRDRPFVATVRHPLELLVSEFEFGWWKRRDMRGHYARVPEFGRRFPGFPDLGFAEYVSLSHAAFRADLGGLPPEEGPGPLTERFVRYYCRHPHEVIARLRAAPDDVEAVRRDLHPVTFLLTHDLNAQLHACLRNLGYPAEAIAFIAAMPRVLPGGRGRGPGDAWTRHYTPELARVVRAREAVLFDLFPAFDRAEP